MEEAKNQFRGINHTRRKKTSSCCTCIYICIYTANGITYTVYTCVGVYLNTVRYILDRKLDMHSCTQPPLTGQSQQGLLLLVLEDVIRHKFLPSLTGQNALNDDIRDLMILVELNVTCIHPHTPYISMSRCSL